MANRNDGSDVWTWVLGIFALGNLANGAWMLLDAAGWFVGIPAAVPDFGPLNEHFVRDVGAAYVTVGLALAWAAFTPSARTLAVGGTTVFYGLHALGHVYDTATGRVGPEHWLIDLPAVYLPVFLLVPLWVMFARRGAA